MFEVLTQIGLPIALILIMTGVGLGLTTTDFRRVFRQPKAFIAGFLSQMILLPLIAVAIISLTGLTGAVAIGLFILALCPGGVTSNMYSYLSKGDVGLSVSLTAVIGFVTPFTIPLLGAWAISYYGEEGSAFSLPILSTWIKLIVISVIPVLIGMAIRAKWESFAVKAEPYVSRFSVIVLALLIISICVNLGEKLIDFAILAGPAAILLNLSTMVAGYLTGRWLLHNEAQSRTITLEVGLQNGTLALAVTTGILQSAPMSVAPSIYSLFMFVSASLFTMIVLRKDRKTSD